jgi:hypothetical protein
VAIVSLTLRVALDRYAKHMARRIDGGGAPSPNAKPAN